nr:serine kinase [Dyella sp. ASV24]
MTFEPETSDLLADPFLERPACRRSIEYWILGRRFRFTSESEALLSVVDAAYAGLPPHVLSADPTPLQIELRVAPLRSEWSGEEPPPVRMQSGAGLLCGVVDATNYVAISPATAHALIVASQDMLAFPYQLRYELIEFAVFTLATRVQGLIPLHGACVGLQGRGLLIMGASGAGKSTLALHGMLEGLELLAEDAVFVHTESLRATGVPNFIHVRRDGLAWVDNEQHREWIAGSPTIRRRSGVEKFEIDLRKGPASLATSLALTGIVFLAPSDSTMAAAQLRPISGEDVSARLTVEQPYAASQQGWAAFMREVSRLRAFELVRGRTPLESVRVLGQLLG